MAEESYVDKLFKMDNIEDKPVNIIRKGVEMKVKVAELRDGDIARNQDGEHLIHSLVNGHTFYRYGGEGYYMAYNLDDRRAVEIEDGLVATKHDFMWLNLVSGTEEYKWGRHMCERMNRELDEMKRVRVG